MVPIVTALIFVAATLGFAALAYYKIKAADKIVYAAGSALNVQLSFRREIIKNLSASASSAARENTDMASILEKLKTEPAADFKISVRAAQEKTVSSSLSDLFKLAAGVPALKDNSGFNSYQKSLFKCEEKISQAAAFYNGAVRDYNTLLAVFPVSLAAKMFDYAPADIFIFEESNPGTK